MKLLSKVMAAFVVVGLLGAVDAMAAKKPKDTGETVSGTVAAAIDTASGDLKISSGKKKSPTEVTVKTDKDTVITYDGQAADASKLTVGTYVTVTKSGDKATKIEATSTAPAKKKKNK